MANLSDQTRKDQILTFLTLRKGEWIDGPDLANERIGGSEGLRRLRELRDDGHVIQQRRHPDPGRDIWQYRLIDADLTPIRIEDRVPVEVPKPVDKKLPEPGKMEFGMHTICPDCKARRKKCDYCGNRGYIIRQAGR